MKQKRRISKMIGMILSGSIIITSIPIAGVAAQNTDSKPTADELLPAGYMKPEDFDRDAVNAYADSIVAGTSSISDIGRLPQYSEFVAQTGYSHSVLSLTVFRETYGTGTDFQAPANAVICIKNESELDLLSSLVNHNEANETAEEQAYYANASYTLQGDILYTSRRFLPIGTVTTPFNGSFDGDGFEITGLQINGDSQSTYTGVEYFGLFGYIGAEGQVSNLGLTNTTINLPYTLGADVGVLAGRNYGTISDCYVNGTENWYDDDYNEYDMNTTRVTVSNGTVGGIAAENYGTIERVYADFVPNVSVTSGSYSDPQPITSVNHGTISDSYYFGEEVTGHYGTAITAEAMRTSGGIPGTKFQGADFMDVSPAEYPEMVTIDQVIDLIGTGDTFDAASAAEFLNREHTVIAVCYNAENDGYEHGGVAWNQFAELVNQEAPNETAEEQAFWSHATIYLGGYEYPTWGEHYYDTYELHLGGEYEPLKSVGTAEHPFNGTFDGAGCQVSFYYNEDDTSPYPFPSLSLFGYIGSNGVVKNLNYSCFNDLNNTVEFDDAPVGVLFSVNYGTVENCQGEIDFGSSQVEEFLQNVFVVGVTNNGTVKDCHVNTGLRDGGTAYVLNAIKTNSGTINNLNIYTSSFYAYETDNFNQLGTLIEDEYHDIPYKEYDAKVGEPYHENPDYRLCKYPTICAVFADSEGYYHISKPSDLMYFIKNGMGEHCVLDNTIDMADNVINQDYTGSFSLDGILTDTDDICSYINLGGTKCYGILNLTFENAAISTGTVDFSNVYFIGGTFTVDSQMENHFGDLSDSQVFVYGKSLRNVHSSMEMIWNGSDGRLLAALSENALDSSYSGGITFNKSSYADELRGVAFNADHCTSYAAIINNNSTYNSGNPKIYTVGYQVINGLNHMDFDHSGASGHANNGSLTIAMGANVENSIAIDTYTIPEQKIAGTVCLFGTESTVSCVFGGHLINYNTAANYPEIAKNVNGFVVDNHAVADGTYTGCSYGENVVFRGTINTTPAYPVKAVGDHITNGYNLGAINLTQDVKANGYVYGVGTAATDCVMAGTINLDKSGDDWNTDSNYAFRNINWFGSGSGMNVSDIIFEDVPIETMTVFRDTTEYCYNYGNITIKTTVTAPTIYIGRQVTHCANFGDVSVEGSKIAYYGLYYLLSSPSSATHGVVKESHNVNFGNIRIMEHGLETESRSLIYPVYVRQQSAYTGTPKYFETADNNYNLGDVVIQADTTTQNRLTVYGCFGGKNHGAVTCNGYTTGDHEIVGGTTENYGNLTADNMKGTSLDVIGLSYAPNYSNSVQGLSTLYRADLKTHGDLTVTNSEVSDLNVCAAKCKLASTNHQLNVDSKSELHLEHIKSSTIKIVGGMEGSELSGYGEKPTIAVSDNAISLTDMEATTISVYGAAAGYGNTTGQYAMCSSTSDHITLSGFKATNVNIYGIADRVFKGSSKANITVENGVMSGSGGIAVYGVGVTCADEAVNTGTISLRSITAQDDSNRNYSVAGVGSVSDSALYNNGAIVVDVDDPTGDLTVSGIGSSVSVPNNTLALNASCIDVTGKYDTVTVAGICGTATAKTDNGVLLNVGNIQIAPSDVNSIVCGGISYGYSTRLINGINLGDVSISKPTEAALSVYGVGTSYDMQSNINWGDITVTGMADNAENRVYAVGIASYAQCAWLNYGSVMTDLDAANEALIGAVDMDGSVSSILARTGINYGQFNTAHLSSNAQQSAWFVDLSGNKNTIPKATFNYSTDPTATNYEPVFFDNTLFDSRSSWSHGILFTTGPGPGTGLRTIDFDYSVMLKPQFGFIFRNPIALKYKDGYVKDEYNGENVLDYADTDELKGQTLSFLTAHFPDMEGGYCLNGSTLFNGDTAGHLDTDIEDCVNLDALSFRYQEIQTRWGEKTVSALFETDLNQRDIGTTAKLNHYITIESVEKYRTNTGVEKTISNKTSLVPYQAPPCGNFNSFVTIADLYMLTNEFESINGRNVSFKLDLQGSKNISFRYFDEPVIYEDEQDMIRKIKTQFSDSAYTGLDIPYSSGDEAFTALPIPAEGETTIALVGLVVSEDGRKTNVLVVELHSVGTVPAAWLTKFSYPTGVNDTQTQLINEDALTGDESTYTESTIYDENTAYTVTTEELTTDTYGSVSVPVYTMSKTMWHTTDGALQDNTNSITGTGELLLKFAAKNVDSYIIYVNAEGSEDTWFATGTMPDTHTQTSDNGVETVKLLDDQNDKYKFRTSTGYDFRLLAAGTVDTAATERTWTTNSFTENNPFLSGGTKTITVGTKSVSGEFIPLLKVVLNKAESTENYLKYSTISRKDNLTADQSLTDTQTVSNIVPSRFSIVYYKDNKFNLSTLSTVGTPTANSYSDFLDAGKTHYPTKISNSIDATAENGDTVTYTHITELPSVELLPISTIKKSSEVVADSENPLIMLTGADANYNVVYGKSSQVPFVSHRNALTYIEGTTVKHYSATQDSVNLKSAEIYVNGTLTATLDGGTWGTTTLVWTGMGLQFSLDRQSHAVSLVSGQGFDKENLPEGIITVKPVIVLNTNNSGAANAEPYTMELQSFSFTKTLSKEHRVIQAKIEKAIVTAAISTMETELSGDVDIYGDGMIDYALTPEETNNFYIVNTVQPDCTGSRYEIKIPAFARLQTYNGTSWQTVFTATGNTVYSQILTFTAAQLGAGYHYNFRVIAQAYDEADDTAKNYVSYYNTVVMATTRNKKISIEFDTGDETMNLYREIISDKGSTAIQIKNMNGANACLQQTKLYKGTSADEMASTYYKLAQGDYAIDVQVPNGYAASLKIVGGSSEGYLQDSGVVKGKRIRLPYANAQSIRLVVYLEKYTTDQSWGVAYENSLYQSARHNHT